ncbi:MAG: hypothetical protein Q4C54_06220, partial [Clostridia bacterium]|nr:hypothetical protein [Clostridia bacterium]
MTVLVLLVIIILAVFVSVNSFQRNVTNADDENILGYRFQRLACHCGEWPGGLGVREIQSHDLIQKRLASADRLFSATEMFYAINSEHYRFGYIPAKSLPKKANVKRLDFERTNAYASQMVSITDGSNLQVMADDHQLSVSNHTI